MKKNNLLFWRAIFITFIVIAFGLIIMNEKGAEIFTPKIKEKINKYIETNYSDIKDSLKISNIKYNNKEFKAKITSNNNKYFYITYNKGTITDTYKDDYLLGNKLLLDVENELEKEIKEITKSNCKVKLIKKLNEYSEKVQNRITNKDFKNLKIYYIEKELVIDKYESKEITNKISSYINTLYTNNITPKYYKITITNKNNILDSIEISNLDETFIDNKNSELIINDIINNTNSNIVKENKITYKYLN